MVVLKRPVRTLLRALIVFSALFFSTAILAQTKSVPLVIRFTDTSIDPTQAAVVAALSETAELNLEYMHPMSGEAHVFVAYGILDEEHLEQVIERLSARPDVLYLLRDEIFLTQTAG